MGALRETYGFRTYQAIEIAVYHTLGKLPKPIFTHKSCERGAFVSYINYG
jgi:hypothetical protein